MTLKFDGGKWRLSLIPVSCLRAVASVLDYGATKYTHQVLASLSELENSLCEKLVNAYNVPVKNLSLRKNSARLATASHPCILPNASAATGCGQYNPKSNYVALVTKEIDSAVELKKLRLSVSTNENTEAILLSVSGKKNGNGNDETTQFTVKNNIETLSLETWLNTEFPRKNTTFFWSKVAVSAEAKNVRTWTMITELDSSEVCFVVSATKDWDCFKMILILCEMLWNTSLSIEEFSHTISGADNWKTVPDARRRYYDAAIRHLTAWWDGETNDPESGLPHLAHAACCIIFLLWLDDNPQKEGMSHGE